MCVSPPVWSACMCETTTALRRRTPSLASAASMTGSEPGGPPSMRPVQEPDLMTVASPCPTSTKTTVVAPEAPLPAPPDAVEPGVAERDGVTVGVGRGVFGGRQRQRQGQRLQDGRRSPRRRSHRHRLRPTVIPHDPPLFIVRSVSPGDDGTAGG